MTMLACLVALFPLLAEPAPLGNAEEILAAFAPAPDPAQAPVGFDPPEPIGFLLAQEGTPPPPPPRYVIEERINGGVGFVSSPDLFLFNLQLDHRLEKNVTLGPRFQVGYSDDDTLFAPTLNVAIYPDLGSTRFGELRPFLQGGVGAAYIEKSDRIHDDDEWGLLLDFGVGLEFPFSATGSLRTDVLFNFLPESVVGETFYFSWNLLSVSIAF